MSADTDHWNSLAQWLSEEFVPQFRNANLEITGPAEELLISALRAQIEEGLADSEDEVLAMLRCFPVDDLCTFYQVKYGARDMTFNRALRFLADMHDRWIFARQEVRRK